jgi:hypothetical protein
MQVSCCFIALNNEIFICLLMCCPLRSCPERGDFHPLPVGLGELAAFHGSLNRHYAPCNPSPYTRVSLDFRVGVGEHFDAKWSLPSARGQHGRKVHRL